MPIPVLLATFTLSLQNRCTMPVMQPMRLACILQFGGDNGAYFNSPNNADLKTLLKQYEYEKFN